MLELLSTILQTPTDQESNFGAFQQNFVVGWAPVAIFLMATAGFALLYAGMVRKKNGSHTILIINVGWTLAFLVYYLIGYPLAYYSDAAILGWPETMPLKNNPLPAAFTNGMYGIPGDGAGDMAQWFKMAMFCITALAIVPGATAERDNFWGWIISAAIISGLIYPMIEHWVWGGGWLGEMGFIDYAGSGAVHLTGGTLGLAAAIVIGPRIGKFSGPNKMPRSFFGHSIPLSVIGAWLLVFGWFGFNIGSNVVSSLQEVHVELAWVSITTAMAMAGGLFGAAFTSRGHVLTSMIGLLSGAVSICSGAHIVHPVSAFIIGIVAGIITTFTLGLLEFKFHVDDALAVFPVHGACGVWGLIAGTLFGHESLGSHPHYGMDTATWGAQLGVQAIGALAIFATAFILGLILFKVIDMFGILRVTKDQELFGTDISIHKTYAYPEEEADKPFFR